MPPAKKAVKAQPQSGWIETIKTLVYALLIALAVRTVAFEPFHIPSGSMIPTLLIGDFVFVSKYSYGYSRYSIPFSPPLFGWTKTGRILGSFPKRGDVVVFQYPRDHTKSYIKRVIGLPGDRVTIDHGRVFVNGKPLVEPYVPARFTDDRSQPEMTIPVNEYFVMGDHRSISSDSRDFGPVERDLIYGKAAFVYWPMDQAGVVR